MKTKLKFYAASILAFTFMFFTPLRDVFDEIKKDKNCVQIQESVSSIKLKINESFKNLSLEKLNEFKQKFKNNVSNLNDAEKNLFFRTYLKDFDLINGEVSKIIASISELSKTNKSFKELNETQRKEFFNDVLQTKTYPSCGYGLVGGTSGCAGWANWLLQQGYSQSYANSQMGYCLITVYISFYICEENGGYWPTY